MFRQALQKRRADERRMKAEARERERQHQAELHERRDASKLFEEYKVSGPFGRNVIHWCNHTSMCIGGQVESMFLTWAKYHPCVYTDAWDRL